MAIQGLPQSEAPGTLVPGLVGPTGIHVGVGQQRNTTGEGNVVRLLGEHANLVVANALGLLLFHRRTR